MDNLLCNPLLNLLFSTRLWPGIPYCDSFAFVADFQHSLLQPSLPTMCGVVMLVVACILVMQTALTKSRPKAESLIVAGTMPGTLHAQAASKENRLPRLLLPSQPSQFCHPKKSRERPSLPWMNTCLNPRLQHQKTAALP